MCEEYVLVAFDLSLRESMAIDFSIGLASCIMVLGK